MGEPAQKFKNFTSCDPKIAFLGETFAENKKAEINFKQLFDKRDNATELDPIEVTVQTESMPELLKRCSSMLSTIEKGINQTYAKSKIRRLSSEKQHQRSLRKKNRKMKNNQIYCVYQKKLQICLETLETDDVYAS